MNKLFSSIGYCVFTVSFEVFLNMCVHVAVADTVDVVVVVLVIVDVMCSLLRTPM